MNKYDTIFLDRDGTLNFDPGYINSLEQYDFFDFTLRALKQLGDAGNRFCIITNQSGIARGIVDTDALSEIHEYILNQFYENGLDLLGIYYCPDHPDDATENRKPGTGMFQLAAHDHGINLAKSIMIGDAVSDIEAGINSGMETMLVLTGKGKASQAKFSDLSPTFIVKNLLEGAQKILGDTS